MRVHLHAYMIDRLVNVLNRKTPSITLAALLLAVMSFAADILGLVRDRILASQFGAGELLDIYYAGFRIPDLLLNLLILGAMSSAFLPLFAERYASHRDDAFRFASNVLTFASLALIVCAAVLFLAAPFLLPLVVPGFNAPALDRAVSVTRVLLLSPILFGVSSLLSAILHYFQRFFVYAIAPILYNLGIIAGALIFAPRLNELGLALGAVLGALLHLGIQVPAARAVGFRFRLHLRPVHAAMRDMVRLAIPRTGNLVVNQLQFTVLTAIASVFAAGSIAVLNFGMNLAFVPVGVIGVSFATAAFPLLSRAYAASDRALFARTFRQAAQEILFLVLPAAALFLVLRAHLVRVILGSGAFGWEDTRLTAAILGALAFGVVGLALLPLLVRTFFAQKDTMTPFFVAVASAVGTIGFAMALAGGLTSPGALHDRIGALFRIRDLPDIRILALPIAVSVVTTLQIVVLFAALAFRGLAREIRKLTFAFMRLSVAATLCGAATWFALRWFAYGVVQETFVGIFLQGLFAGLVGVLAYLFVAFAFAFPEFVRFLRLLRESLPPLRPILSPFESALQEHEKREERESGSK